jgi:hypothetical protein
MIKKQTKILIYPFVPYCVTLSVLLCCKFGEGALNPQKNVSFDSKRKQHVSSSVVWIMIIVKKRTTVLKFLVT